MSLYPQLTNRYTSHGAGRCSRCHRVLTDPASIARGIGPECMARRGMDAGGDLCVRDRFSDILDNTIPFSQALVLKRQPKRQRSQFFDHLDPGDCVTNVPHLVVHHSPDGYEFGYAGSGPADLALNCCQLYLNITDYEGQQTNCYDGRCWSLAFAIHQDFKHAFIASATNEGCTIPFADLDDWFKSHITRELLEQFRVHTEEE